VSYFCLLTSEIRALATIIVTATSKIFVMLFLISLPEKTPNIPKLISIAAIKTTTTPIKRVITIVFLMNRL